MESKEKLTEQAYNLAFKFEVGKGSCLKCVLAAIKTILDVEDETTIKSADVLVGGTTISANGTCGALVGGMLAISSIADRNYVDFMEGKKKRRIFVYEKNSIIIL